MAYPRPDGPPVTALRRLSFRVGPGEALGVSGVSGSGKSTLALALAGLLPPGASVAARRLELDGAALLGLSESAWRRRRGAEIGCVFQQPFLALSPWRRVGDQLADVLRAHRPVSAREARAEARALLEEFSLGGELAEAFPHQLSGGQRQRIVFCQAVIAGPRLLIADEPTASLDADAAGQLLDFVERLRRRRGLSLLFISHDSEVLARMTDRRLSLGGETEVEKAVEEAVEKTVEPPLARPLPARDGATPLLAARGVAVELGRGRLFGRRRRRHLLLDEVDFELEPGEVVGLHGSSGSGKTTLLRCLAGLLAPSRGRVEIGGADPWTAGALDRRRLRRRVPMVGQDPARWADPRWPLWRIVSEGLASRPAAPESDRSRLRAAAAGAMAGLGLGPELLDRRPTELSGGQLQRALLARAVADPAGGPSVLLLDEAFSALDPPRRRRTLELVLGLREKHGLALVVVSHQKDWLRSFCGRMVEMEKGRLI